MVEKSNKPTAEGTANNTSDKKTPKAGSTKETSVKASSAKAASTKAASTSKAAPKKTSPAKSIINKNGDSASTKKVGGGTKTHPVSAERLKAAEDVIKKKPLTKPIDDEATLELKRRASEAKRRAQEKILDEAYVSDPAHPLERLANTFDTSARRWEMVVYPSMFAFILLAGYGFYLIYHLTHDISILSKNVSHMAEIVSDTMPRMSNDINGMTGSMDNMTGDMSNMSTNVSGMTGNISKMSDQMTTLRPMSNNLANMTDTMSNMNRSVYGMNRNVGNLNRTVSSGPFGMMNDIMPFSSDSYDGPGVLPPPIRYAPSMAPPPQYMAQPRNSMSAPAAAADKK